MRLLSALILVLLASSAVSAEDRLRRLDYVPLVAAGTLDITSTVLSPGREQNRAINWIAHEPTRLTVGAAMEVTAFTLAHQALGKKHPKLVRAAILTATAIHVFAASANLQQVKGRRR